MSISTPSSSSSSSLSSPLPPVVPPPCLNVPVLYELLKGEEEHCRMWLRAEMNQIPDSLIDSLFHGLIMSSSSSAVPQHRSTLVELRQQLEGEKVEVSIVLRGEMERLTESLFEILTNKLRTSEDLYRSYDGDDRAQMVAPFDQVESHNPQSYQPSSLIPQPSTFGLDSQQQQQHSNGDELVSNTVEMIQIKEEVEDETRIIDIEALTQQVDCVKQEIKGEFDYEHEIEIKQEEEEDDEDDTNNEVKVEIKEEIKVEDDEEDNNICIKQEYEYVKEEIKEEYDDEDHDDDCGGCPRCIVKRELVEDEYEQEDYEGGGIRGGDNDEMYVERYEVIQASLDNGQLLCSPFGDNQNGSNDGNVNELIGEGGANFASEQQMSNTSNELNERTVTQSGELFSPSTSTGQASNGTAPNEQATLSTQHNGHKRKQAQLIRTGKRVKVTVQAGDGEGGEDGEDIAGENREEAKIKVLNLNCTESECNVKLDSLNDLHDHLRTTHQLSPLQCFASNCNSRFDKSSQIRVHLKLHQSQITRFLCPVCHQTYDSQTNAYYHWYHYHLSGQFECNLVSDCAEVCDTRKSMENHQRTAHHAQSKHLHCTHVGCAASFSFQIDLKRHELAHLNTRPFHCNWLNCSHRTNRRAHLIKHIRTQHFGLPTTLKEQKAKNIVDLRDPNEYVRVVAEGTAVE